MLAVADKKALILHTGILEEKHVLSVVPSLERFTLNP